jgi:bifunctional enzyme CysN/CysC
MGARGALVRVVACGSVDDGKSTLIGRLLAGTGSAPADQLDAARTARRVGSTIPAGQIDYSLLTDGLQAEREQGITIDVAYRHLLLPSGRRAVIADAPGHEQYTRNMVVAASTADAAVLLVDAERGLRRQTFRHLTVGALMGVRQVIVAVNKLDAVGFDRSTFDRLAAEVVAAAGRVEAGLVQVIPVSALHGDNVATGSSRTGWYRGPTVLQALEGVDVPHVDGQEFRLPVQLVLRAPGFRGLAGTVALGRVEVGDVVHASGSGRSARVTRIVTGAGDREAAVAGDAVCVQLDPEVDVARGDLLTGADVPLPAADRFSADLVWLGDRPLTPGRSYLLGCGPLVVPAVVTVVRHRLDVESGHRESARLLGMNEVGRVEIATDRPVPLDAYARARHTGGFVLVDRVSADTVAAGMVRYALRRSGNVVPHAYAVTRHDREQLNGHRARVVWLTGLSGAGKSTIADHAQRRLHAVGIRTFILDGDNLRGGINKDLGFTEQDRAENVRRVAEIARLLLDSGTVVLVALISPFRADRLAARALFTPDDFLEIYVDTPVEVCAERDTKGLYARAAAGALPNLTGVGQAYEPPQAANLVLDGGGAVDTAVDILVDLILRRTLRGSAVPDETCPPGEPAAHADTTAGSRPLPSSGPT